MPAEQLHKAQVQVLYALRHSPAARYSDLMRPTGMESADFKFHLRNLVKKGLVDKNTLGLYQLTTAGKEYANNLDHAKRRQQKQPKLSVLIIARRTVDGEVTYLLQQRQRNPFWGYWGVISGPVGWGEDFEAAAARELLKQTSLSAQFKVKGFFRKRDFNAETEELLEDKLFVLLEAQELTGSLQNSWNGGINQWMTLADLSSQDQQFTETASVLQQLTNGTAYQAADMYHHSQDY